MKQIMFLNFTGVDSSQYGYAGWTAASSSDITVPESPFRTFSHSHGQNVMGKYFDKFASLRQAVQDNDVPGMEGISTTVGSPAVLESCPFDLSDSILLSKQSKRRVFSAAVVHDSDAVPALLDSSNSTRMNYARSDTPMGASGYEETGTSSSVRFPFRALMVDVVTALAPQVIEVPNAEAYGQGFELGMGIAAKMTETPE